MEVYIVVVIKQPTAKEVYDLGSTDEVIVQPVAVMAKDDAHAVANAMRLVPKEYEDQIDRLEVRVLPFRRPT